MNSIKYNNNTYDLLELTSFTHTFSMYENTTIELFMTSNFRYDIPFYYNYNCIVKQNSNYFILEFVNIVDLNIIYDNYSYEYILSLENIKVDNITKSINRQLEACKILEALS